MNWNHALEFNTMQNILHDYIFHRKGEKWRKWTTKFKMLDFDQNSFRFIKKSFLF